jgi:hypothetical protein
VNASLITGLDTVGAIAVAPVPEPSTAVMLSAGLGVSWSCGDGGDFTRTNLRRLTTRARCRRATLRTRSRCHLPRQRPALYAVERATRAGTKGGISEVGRLHDLPGGRDHEQETRHELALKRLRGSPVKGP